ncbi:hypothetical protein BRC92_01830 [Halobacteriales archaeon QS_4_69_31]|nr:MAG: hypothetical protein BRC92_01830 [Halobacteriales archaeon QS_4_69_31]
MSVRHLTAGSTRRRPAPRRPLTPLGRPPDRPSRPPDRPGRPGGPPSRPSSRGRRGSWPTLFFTRDIRGGTNLDRKPKKTGRDGVGTGSDSRVRTLARGGVGRLGVRDGRDRGRRLARRGRPGSDRVERRPGGDGPDRSVPVRGEWTGAGGRGAHRRS